MPRKRHARPDDLRSWLSFENGSWQPSLLRSVYGLISGHLSRAFGIEVAVDVGVAVVADAVGVDVALRCVGKAQRSCLVRRAPSRGRRRRSAGGRRGCCRCRRRRPARPAQSQPSPAIVELTVARAGRAELSDEPSPPATELKRSTRLLPVSATISRSTGSKVRPSAPETWPAAEPAVSIVPTNDAVGVVEPRRVRRARARDDEAIALVDRDAGDRSPGAGVGHAEREETGERAARRVERLHAAVVGLGGVDARLEVGCELAQAGELAERTARVCRWSPGMWSPR